jgi:hypothetical protein
MMPGFSGIVAARKSRVNVRQMGIFGKKLACFLWNHVTETAFVRL